LCSDNDCKIHITTLGWIHKIGAVNVSASLKILNIIMARKLPTNGNITMSRREMDNRQTKAGSKRPAVADTSASETEESDSGIHDNIDQNRRNDGKYSNTLE
jgi:hypothetical protein